MFFCSARLYIIFFTKALWLLRKNIILGIQIDKPIKKYICSRDLDSLSLIQNVFLFLKQQKLSGLLEHILYIPNSSWKWG